MAKNEPNRRVDLRRVDPLVTEQPSTAPIALPRLSKTAPEAPRWTARRAMRERRGEPFGPSHADATTKTRRPAGGDASPSATTHERVSILLR